MATDDVRAGTPGPFRALAPLIATISMTFVAQVASSIWLPAYAKIFRFTPAVMGLIGSVPFAAAAVVMLFLTPRLLRSLQPRTLILAGLTTVAAAEVLTVVLNPNAASFALLRVVEGSGIGLATASAGVLASFTANPTRTFGILQLSQSVATTVMFGLAGGIVQRFGILGIFAFVGLGVVAATPFALATPRAPLTLKAGSAARRSPSRFPLVGFVILAMIFVVNVGASTHMGDFGMRIGMTMGQVSVVLAAASALGIVSSLLAAVLAGRVPTWVLLVGGATIAGAGLIGLGIAPTPGALMAAACTMWFGSTLATPAVIGVVSGSDNTGRAASAAQAAIVTGTALGPACSGVIEDFLSLRALSVVFAIVIPLAFLATAVLATRRSSAALPA
jgi:MFS family permease